MWSQAPLHVCARQEFVEVRRSALQHYMEQLAAHPVIARSQVLPCMRPGTVALVG
jgi:hypothetical protein